MGSGWQTQSHRGLQAGSDTAWLLPNCGYDVTSYLTLPLPPSHNVTVTDCTFSNHEPKNPSSFQLFYHGDKKSTDKQRPTFRLTLMSGVIERIRGSWSNYIDMSGHKSTHAEDGRWSRVETQQDEVLTKKDIEGV